MSPVEYAWLVPALPLAAALIVLFVTRPLAVAGRPKPANVGAGHGVAHDEHAEAASAETGHSAAPDAAHPAAGHETAGHDDGGGHGGMASQRGSGTELAASSPSARCCSRSC